MGRGAESCDWSGQSRARPRGPERPETAGLGGGASPGPAHPARLRPWAAAAQSRCWRPGLAACPASRLFSCLSGTCWSLCCSRRPSRAGRRVVAAASEAPGGAAHVAGLGELSATAPGLSCPQGPPGPRPHRRQLPQPRTKADPEAVRLVAGWLPGPARPGPRDTAGGLPSVGARPLGWLRPSSSRPPSPTHPAGVSTVSNNPVGVLREPIQAHSRGGCSQGRRSVRELSITGADRTAWCSQRHAWATTRIKTETTRMTPEKKHRL